MEDGVLYAEGTRCVSKGDDSPSSLLFYSQEFISGVMGIAEYDKITEEEAIAIENSGDPIEAPPG